MKSRWCEIRIRRTKWLYLISNRCLAKPEQRGMFPRNLSYFTWDNSRFHYPVRSSALGLVFNGCRFEYGQLYRISDGVEGVTDRATSWTVRGLNPGCGKKFLSSSKRPHRLWFPPSLRPGREADHSSPFGAEVNNKCTHLHLVPRVIISALIFIWCRG